MGMFNVSEMGSAGYAYNLMNPAPGTCVKTPKPCDETKDPGCTIGWGPVSFLPIRQIIQINNAFYGLGIRIYIGR